MIKIPKFEIRNSNLKNIDPWMLVAFGIVVLLVFSLISEPLGINFSMKSVGGVKGLSAQPVYAEEIYPMFTCPCCGKPLDKKNICCAQAQERIDYIDSLVKQKGTKDEVVLTYVKKYGLNSLADKNKAGQIKQQLAQSAPADRPIITLNPKTIDLGAVSLKKGKVSTYFDLTNEGKSDLVINKLDTACGCTSASVVYDGQEGPLFAMAGHGIKSPTDWQLTIPPGKKAQLKVYYDPTVHKDLRGPVTREVSVFSNDPVNFETKVTLELNQAD